MATQRDYYEVLGIERTASNGEIAVSFSLLSTNLPQNISRLQQVRLGAVQIPQAVPEPGSLGLLGAGLLGVAVLVRRRKSKV